MQELLVDFITSLDGYGAAEGWPGFWGLQGPEYLAWLGEQPERDYTILMGANTYRLMSGFAAEAETLEADEATAVDELARTPKVVFSSTLQPPLAWGGGSGRPFPRGCLPRDHREHGPRPDLRRLSGRCARHGCQPNIRRPAPAPRVCPDGAHRPTGHATGFLTINGTSMRLSVRVASEIGAQPSSWASPMRSPSGPRM
jgi:hypothetical protein